MIRRSGILVDFDTPRSPSRETSPLHGVSDNVYWQNHIVGRVVERHCEQKHIFRMHGVARYHTSRSVVQMTLLSDRVGIHDV